MRDDNSIKEDVDKLLEKENVSIHESKAVSHLSQKTEEIALDSKEERFVWILIVTILLDILLLKDCANWSLPWVVVILELTAVFIAGQKLDIKPLKLLFFLISETFSKK